MYEKQNTIFLEKKVHTDECNMVLCLESLFPKFNIKPRGITKTCRLAKSPKDSANGCLGWWISEKNVYALIST